MDQRACELSARMDQNASDVKCAKMAEAIACPTPQKMATPPSATKSKEGRTQILPEKYMTLADLFTSVNSSLWLLRMLKKPPTFENVCTRVEFLSKRKLSYAHLAQMKYLLPEALHIGKAIVHDKESMCMKPDMMITLVFEVVKEHSKSAAMSPGQYFCSRLIDFFNMHPEADDIPKAILPEPFNQKQKTCSLICEDLPVNSSTALSSTSIQIELLPEIFHLSPSFHRHFSLKNVATQACFSFTKSSLLSNESACLDNQESESRGQKECMPLSDPVTILKTGREQQQKSYSASFHPSVIDTPGHMICSPHSVNCSGSESPDIKIVSSTDSLVTETPVQSTPRRLMPSSDVKILNTTTKDSTSSCYKPAKRVLDFSQMEGDDSLEIEVDKLESSRVLHEVGNILESSEGCSENRDASGSVTLPLEVEESIGCAVEKANQIPAGLDSPHQKPSSPLDLAPWKVEESISCALKKANQIPAGLDSPHQKPSLLQDLVNVIHSIFQSVKMSPITREELLHKIIMNSLDFVEIREAEEQVEFLGKLVPDWICKKVIPTGDVMYCIKKVSDLNAVRSKLLCNVTAKAE